MNGARDESSREPRARLPRPDTLRAAAVLAVVLLAFFATPILHLGDGFYSSADVSQDSPLMRVDREYRAKNAVLGDPAVQMQPWLMFSRDELRSGRMPLWNPFNGGGSPLVANYQSAVFSPFSLPFYVLGVRLALLVAAFAKLFTAGMFTYLFLRRLSLAWRPAVFGATAFMISAQLIVMLAYPHSGAIAILPAALYFAHGVCAASGAMRDRRDATPRGNDATRDASETKRDVSAAARDAIDATHVESDSKAARAARNRAHRRRSCAGLALALGIGLLAGAPETFCFSLIFVALYSATLLAARAIDLARRRASTGPVFHSALLAIGAGVLGLAIGAVQVMPFLEYLANCAIRVDVHRARACMLEPATWPLLVFPKLLGAPSEPWANTEAFPPPMFPVAASVCAGAIVLFLAVVSLAWIRRSFLHAFFAVATVAWAVYAYDLSALARDVVEAIPVLRLLPPNHGHHLGVFGICVCASFALDRIDRSAIIAASLSRRRVLALAAGAFVFAALFAWGAHAFGPLRYEELSSNAGLVEAASSHVRATMLVFAAGCAALCVQCSTRSALARAAAGPVLLASVFLCCGAPLRDYNPTIPDRTFYPRTPAIEALQRAVGDERLVVLGTDALPPGENLVHRLRMLSSYDALWVGAFDELYREEFGGRDYWRSSTRASPAAMRLFGATYLLAPRGWNPAASHFAGTDFFTRRAFVLDPLLPGAPLSQTFTATEDGLSSILVPVLTNKRVHRCTLGLRLTERNDGATSGTSERASSSDVIFERSIACERWDDRDRATHDLVVSFPPLPHSAGKTYELEIRSDDADLDTAVRLYANSDFADIEDEAARASGVAAEKLPRGRLERAGSEIGGGLVFDWSDGGRAFRKVADVGALELLRLARPCSRYHRVERAELATSIADAFARTTDPTFDAMETVVLAPAGGALASSARSLAPPAGTLALLDASRGGSARADARVTRSSSAEPSIAEETTDVRVVVEQATHIELDVGPARAGYLVLAIPWYPGWRAKIDGRSAPLLRANFAFTALELDSDAKQVVLDFAPASFVIGAWISALAIAATAWLALVPRSRR